MFASRSFSAFQRSSVTSPLSRKEFKRIFEDTGDVEPAQVPPPLKPD